MFVGTLVSCGGEPVPTQKVETTTEVKDEEVGGDIIPLSPSDDSIYYDIVPLSSDNTIVEDLDEFIEVRISNGASVESDSILIETTKVPRRVELLLNSQGKLEQVLFDRSTVKQQVERTSTELLLNPKRVRVLGKKVTMTYISRYYNVSLSKIREYNPGIDIDKIRVNQVINLECNCGNPNK